MVFPCLLRFRCGISNRRCSRRYWRACRFSLSPGEFDRHRRDRHAHQRDRCRLSALRRKLFAEDHETGQEHPRRVSLPVADQCLGPGWIHVRIRSAFPCVPCRVSQPCISTVTLDESRTHSCKTWACLAEAACALEGFVSRFSGFFELREGSADREPNPRRHPRRAPSATHIRQAPRQGCREGRRGGGLGARTSARLVPASPRDRTSKRA